MQYNEELIIKESSNCLNCKIKPCSIKGCPLNNDIPKFISLVKQEKYEEAYQVLTETTVLPSICGRICPHKKQCMGSCVKGIKGQPVNIGELEAFIGDMAIENKYDIKKYSNDLENKSIAVIGGGPAGLTAAAFLARRNAKVTIYEKYDYLGGILIHGIPEFRLSKDLVKKSINKILDLGIKVKYKQELGKNLNISDIENNYDYIILAFGANVSSKMGIDGENLINVYGGNELLENNNHPDYKGKTVIVNGGGNVAMDTARTVKRLGAKEVIVVYRRAREQMPAEDKEVKEAMDEGVKFLFQNNIIRIEGDIENKVSKVELIKTELVNNGENRLSPVNIENSNYKIDVDIVIMALGSKTEGFVSDLKLLTSKSGRIVVDENGKTSNKKIFAVGDLAGNNGTVAFAARSGRNVADCIVNEKD